MSEIIVGTYEDYIIGYNISDDFVLDQSFSHRGHSGSVTQLATSADGRLVMSVGYDEMVNVFDLKKRKLLQTFEGAYNCLQYVENTHVICGSEDSNIYIYEFKASEMILAKTLRGHKLGVTSLSVHPSGKLLVSLSKDNTMRTWNLIKGRIAYVSQIKPEAHIVAWSIDGERFVIAAKNEIYLYTCSGNLEHNIQMRRRINSIEFLNDNIFAVASDSRELELVDVKEGKTLAKFEAHETRIKSIKRFSCDTDQVRFATGSSDGQIKLWALDGSSKDKPKELGSTDVGARLTCMTAAIREPIK